MIARRRDERRVALGDFQTPEGLAEEVLRVACGDADPSVVLEPTCGEGAFLAAASRRFPRARLVGFDINADYVDRARARLPAERSSLTARDFFQTPWERVVSGLGDPLLVVGNPPWVTSAALGALGAHNLPPKTNEGRLSGMDARTGKSNFDISEWMIRRLLEALGERRFTLAMLCKAKVARRLMEHVATSGAALYGEVRAIDARLHFGAAVDAVLLVLKRGTLGRSAESPVRWGVYDALGSAAPRRIMGVVEGRLCSDLGAYARTRSLEGASGVAWRSGLKHDCSDVMELDRDGGRMRNGLGEAVDVEAEHVFPLLKGSDVANGRLTPSRAVIVPQRRLGEDTYALRERAPRLWRYLDAHRASLDARKSSVYRARPPFAIFGVGDYSFAPYKVAICGLYKKLAFAVVRPFGGLPVMVDDTVYFLPCSSEREAERVAAALSSRRAQSFFEARIFWDEKRPIGKAVLQRISIERLLEADGREGRASP